MVTFRNNLNKIGFTPYNRRDPWQLDATLVDGTLCGREEGMSVHWVSDETARVTSFATVRSQLSNGVGLVFRLFKLKSLLLNSPELWPNESTT